MDRTTTSCDSVKAIARKLRGSSVIKEKAETYDVWNECLNCLYHVICNASNFASGAELSQLQDGSWRTIAFHSQSFNNVEQNYEIFDKELLAIIHALKQWQHFLEGAAKPFEIHTDHQNLEYFKTMQDLSCCQACWSLFLSCFHSEIHYISGKTNCADGLSRQPDLNQGVKDNENQILLKPELFVNEIVDVIPNNPTIQWICNANLNIKDYKYKEKNSSSKWSTIDNLILYDNLIYVPDINTLHNDIIQSYHEEKEIGHPGCHKTLELIVWNYYWPKICEHVAKFTKTCLTCQCTKILPASKSGFLQPNETPTQPWGVILVDMIVSLPESSGFTAILVVVNQLTKYAHFIPTNNKLCAPGVAHLYQEHIWKYHSLPNKVISNCGTQFASEFMQELNTLFKISTALSTAYHLETDGQTEWVNMELEQFLWLYINFQQDDWSKLLSWAQFAYNNHTHSSTGASPFLLNHGIHPCLPMDPSLKSSLKSLDQFIMQMHNAHKAAKKGLEHAADNMKDHADWKWTEAPKYHVGNKVWLSGKYIATNQPTKKLAHKCYRPFVITWLINPSVVKLALPKTWKNHPVFVSLIKPVSKDPIAHPIKPPPPPVKVEGEEEWEIEEILKLQMFCKQLQYLIHWKGFSVEEDSWVYASDIHAKALINAFHKKFPSGTPHSISTVDWNMLPFQKINNTTSTLKSDQSQLAFFKQADPYFKFTNCYKCPIYWKGNKYLSIMELYEDGQQHALCMKINWERKKVKFMHNIQLVKYWQNPQLATLLSNCYPHCFSYNNPSDSFWGTGPDGNSQNQLGCILFAIVECITLEQSLVEDSKT
jgi:predicted NAD-dependent protein-ADP-ribosyltransferase YbiA (DUF1768 family)